MQTLRGRTCLFAGATTGDGPAAVRQLCEGGMNVIMMSHNPEIGKALEDEINARKPDGRCHLEIGGKTEEREKLYRQIAERSGSIDVIISNIGADGKKDSLETLTQEQLQRSLMHLVGGSLNMLQGALPYLRKSKAARVIFMTTPEGCGGGCYESLSNSIAKGAVRTLMLSAAARLVKDGITVNCISKGPIPRLDPVPEGGADPRERLETVPMGRLGTLEDLAGAICFLASEESGFITGQILEVNGGLNLKCL